MTVRLNLTPAALADLALPILASRARIHAADLDDLVLLRAELDSTECGLVVLDLVSGDDDEAVLIEIFVVPHNRGAGVGGDILTLAEEFARNVGRTRMTLHAEPLDEDDEDRDAKLRLVDWYRRRGYRHVAGPWDELEKQL